MTIAEAVELYNEVQDKIKKMDKLMARIFTDNQPGFQPGFLDPMHIDHFYVHAKDMQEIADFLTEYKKHLKKELDATFEPGDTGNG